MEGALDDLLRHPALWRAAEGVRDAGAGGYPATVACGFPVLDRHLPGGGWPLGALVEVLYREPGIGELSLLLPALAHLAGEGRWLAWIAPPYRIAVPALQAVGVDPARVLVVRGTDAAQVPWAAEQALRSGACGAVLWWLRGRRAERGGGGARGEGFRQLRRLQLAAQAGHSLGVVFRDARAAAQASPAVLRLLLVPAEQGVQVTLLKRRGAAPACVTVDFARHPAR